MFGLFSGNKGDNSPGMMDAIKAMTGGGMDDLIQTFAGPMIAKAINSAKAAADRQGERITFALTVSPGEGLPTIDIYSHLGQTIDTEGDLIQRIVLKEPYGMDTITRVIEEVAKIGAEAE